MLPGAEVELAVGDRNHHLSAHDGALEMSVGIVLVAIVPVLTVGLFRSQFFQPGFVILMEAAFIVVDEYAGGDVHRIDQTEAFLNATFVQAFLDQGSDMNDLAAAGCIEPKLLAISLHILMIQKMPIWTDKLSLLSAAVIVGLLGSAAGYGVEEEGGALYNLRPVPEFREYTIAYTTSEETELKVRQVENEPRLMRSVTSKESETIRRYFPSEGARGDRFEETLRTYTVQRKEWRDGELYASETNDRSPLLNVPLIFTKESDSWSVKPVDSTAEVPKTMLVAKVEEALVSEDLYYPSHLVRVGDEWKLPDRAIYAVIGALPIKLVQLGGWAKLEEVNELLEGDVATISFSGNAAGMLERAAPLGDVPTGIKLEGKIELSLTLGYERSAEIRVGIVADNPDDELEPFIFSVAKLTSWARPVEVEDF